MENLRTPDLHPSALPPGTLVGGWRVVGRRGLGVYGAVYCAVRVGQEQAGLVAIKIAVHEGDLRFQREVELLSRARHSSIPGLLDHGDWRSPAGRIYPYFVMEWVEGKALYDWSAEHNPSTRQVLRLLSQVARALEATHAAGGVHRDVKGANVLVREGDGRAFLVDFGAGHHTGASTLTWDTLPPGTPAYRSPEAWRSTVELGRPTGAHYTARPTDDVFALGVMAYRLVTEEYPPALEPRDDDEGRWYVPAFHPRPPQERNARVTPRLSALILRMLSEKPEARGTARELAEALEQAARPSPTVRIWVGLAGLGLLVLALTRQRVERSSSEAVPLVAGVEASTRDTPDAGTSGVGDTALTSAVETPPPMPSGRGIRRDMPPQPLKGQRLAPCGKGEWEIRGGCWIKMDARAPQCEDYAYIWKEGCYIPAPPPHRPSTSDEQ